MASTTSADFQREHRLIEQLEFRIATADTDEKFESIVQKFLPALILKLASENERNRNLTIKVCQHVSQRVKLSQSIRIPIPGLLKAFKETPNAFVRRFSLLFLQQGFGRVDASRSGDLLPDVLQFSVPQSRDTDLTGRKMWSIAFDFLLDTLSSWKAPERGSKEDATFKDKFAISYAQCDVLAEELCRFLLYDPKVPTPSSAADDDFRPVYEKQFRQRSQVAPRIADFLFSSLFTDEHRLIPATIMTVDPNATVNNTGDTMFKQCNFDLESSSLVEALFLLYQSARPKLQTRILSLLSKSRISTAQSERIFSMIEMQLNSHDSGLEASKLRSALFSYLTWAVRVSDSIEQISQQTQVLLKDYIESQGWPSMRDRTSAEAELRSRAYESIGLLAGKGVQGQPDFGLLVWLFTSLRCDSTADIRASIEEALARVMNFPPVRDHETAEKLRTFLLWNAKAETGEEDPIYYFATTNSTKYVATRFANKCLPFDDPVARLIDVLAITAQGRRELFEEGVRGLDPYWHESNQKLTSSPTDTISVPMPDLGDLVAILLDGIVQEKFQGASLQSYLAAAVPFCRNVLVTGALTDQKWAFNDFTDWKARVDGLVENDQQVRARLKQYLQEVDQGMLGQLVQHSVLGLSIGSSECASTAVELLSLVSNAQLSRMGTPLLRQAQAGVSQSSVQIPLARCFGILASLDPTTQSLFDNELAQCKDWNTAIGAEAVKVRGHLLAASYTLSRSSLRKIQKTSSSSIAALAKALQEIILSTHDMSLLNASFQCLSQLALYLDPSLEMDLSSDKVIDKLVSECKKENERAVQALGHVLGFRASKWEKQYLSDLLDRVFKLHEIKKPEVHFALGESLAVAVAGFKSTSLLTELDIDVTAPSWGYHEGMMVDIVDKVIESCKSTKPTLRKAAAIWLLNLMQYCGDLVPLKSRLRECQSAFARLLNDRDEIVQETGSRGLSIVYEKGDKALRDDLVRDLVQSFTGSNAKMSGTVSEDTQLFEAGTLPTEGGQSVSTYKDIVGLATEMGDPSLVYRFMNLASNNAIWSSRAAFGRFGLSNILADSSYLSDNKKFYPKLFRYRFDPNPNVQRSMNEIWRALVKDSNAVINENFDLIMDDLLKSVVSGREWRAREASCAAIMDLVQGRDLEKYEKYLDDIWNIAFKILDDVKETVRVAAMQLCRSLTNMLIRNLEVGQGTTKRATVMLNHVMPFLLKQMEGGSAQEVQQYATVSLLEIVKKSPPRSLQAFAPLVLETLINSLSTLEHEGINYLHLNADKYGLTAEKLDKMRVSSVNASPVTEAIDSCLESITSAAVSNGDDTAMDGVEQSVSHVMEDAMRRLEATFKTALGLPSRVGLSRVIVTLVVRYHGGFRPYADRFAQLNRKNILDRNATISIAFSTSLGYLMRLSSEKEVQATSTYAQKLYFESQELSHRSVAGEILQAISKTSNDVFLKYASTFLPFAFIGRKDTNDDVRERFDPPWKDNIGGSRAVQLYLKEITALISNHIKSPLWPIKHACCFAVAAMVETADAQGGYNEAEAKLIWPLIEEALGGKTWDGKEKVVSSFPKFVKSAQVLWTDARITAQMQKIILRESKRTNQAYRPHAIDALGDFAQVRPDLDVSADVFDYFDVLVDELINEDAMDVDDPKGLDAKSQSSTVESTLKVIASCTFRVLPIHGKSNVLEHALTIAKKVHTQQSETINIALFDALALFFSELAKESEGKGARRAANQSGEQNASGTNEAHERFSEEVIVLAFSSQGFSRHGSEPEKLRKSRINLAMTIAQSEACSFESRARLGSILDTWLETERSRPLREELQKAKEMVRIIVP